MVENGRLAQLVSFLSMALRDRPGDFDLRPDRNGLVSLMDLMGVILDEPDFSWVTMRDVDAAVRATDPPLFEISGTSISLVGSRRAGRGRTEQGQSPSKRKRRRKRKPHGSSPADGKAAPVAQPSARASGPSDGAKPTSGEGGPNNSSKRRRRRRRKPARPMEPKS